MATPQLSLTADDGVCGDTLALDIPVLDDGGAPIDTGLVTAAEFRYRHLATGQRGSLLTLGSGVAVADLAGAVYRCTVGATESAGYRSGRWSFHLRVTSAGGKSTTAYGTRTLLPSVI